MAAGERAEEIRLLREIARRARVSALPGLRERAKELLETDSKKRAYAAMDGATGLVAIEKATGANHNDVAKWLKGWVPEGLVDPDASPPRATFTLAELGIDQPPPKTARAKKSAA
jgi:hypothetical protein